MKAIDPKQLMTVHFERCGETKRSANFKAENYLKNSTILEESDHFISKGLHERVFPILKVLVYSENVTFNLILIDIKNRIIFGFEGIETIRILLTESFIDKSEYFCDFSFTFTNTSIEIEEESIIFKQTLNMN